MAVNVYYSRTAPSPTCFLDSPGFLIHPGFGIRGLDAAAPSPNPPSRGMNSIGSTRLREGGRGGGREGGRRGGRGRGREGEEEGRRGGREGGRGGGRGGE